MEAKHAEGRGTDGNSEQKSANGELHTQGSVNHPRSQSSRSALSLANGHPAVLFILIANLTIAPGLARKR
jgi:hypothetical protein